MRNDPPSLNFFESTLSSLGLLLGFTDLFTPINKYRKIKGDFFKITLGREKFYFFSHPRHAKYILKDNPQNFPKIIPSYVPKGYQLMKTAMGNGMITTEGPPWREQKKRVSPFFLGPVIKSFEGTLQYTLSQLFDELKQKRTLGNSFNIEPLMRVFPLIIIGFIIFGEDLNRSAGKVREVLNTFLQYFNKGMSGILPPLWVPTPMNLKHRAAINYMRKTIYRFYESRKSNQTNPPDLLTAMIKTRDETSGEPLSFQQILDEIVTILLSGHETTANALCWIIYMIATHPEWEEKLLKEWTFEGLIPTYEDLQNYTYTKMVIQETMRLYPPVWILGRTCKDGDVIDGYEIQKNTNIDISIYHIHHHPEFWDNPDQFDPERFHPSKLSSINEFAYIPFSQGGHACLGRDLTMLEMMTAIPAIFKRYKVKIPPHAKIGVEAIISTRPKYGMEVILEPRSP